MKPLALVAIICLAFTTCTEHPTAVVPPPPAPPPPPPAGTTLSLVLASPNSDDGAIRLELRGPSLLAPAAGDSTLRVFTHPEGDSLLRVIVVGRIGTAPLLTVPTGGSQPPTAYSAAVMDVADTSGGMRASLQGYRLDITTH
jgi:hypothetical protein